MINEIYGRITGLHGRTVSRFCYGDYVVELILKRSTMQRYIYKGGFGRKQMKKYMDAGKSSSRRFCKPHRMMLVESDIKYGLKLPTGPNGAMVQTYIVNPPEYNEALTG